MGWLIAALGTALAIGGTVAIYSGAPYIQIEWGYAEVIAGTTALSAGILAVALAAILFALRDLRRLATRRPEVLDAGRGMGPVPPAVAVPERLEPVRSLSEQPKLDEAPAQPQAAVPEADQAPTVVGRYEANGASYVLFSDGTIEVETETGTHRYASMSALRAHIAQQDAG